MNLTQSGSPWSRSYPNLLSGLVVLAIGLLAWAIDAPALAPPLGVTALLCMQSPESPLTRPRSILLGHTVGLAAGWLALALCGGLELPSALPGPFSLRHAVAAGLAIAATAGGMDWLRCPHPPAGATTLVVALGMMTTWVQFAAFLLGALVVTGCSEARKRLQGRPVPEDL